MDNNDNDGKFLDCGSWALIAGVVVFIFAVFFVPWVLEPIANPTNEVSALVCEFGDKTRLVEVENILGHTSEDIVAEVDGVKSLYKINECRPLYDPKTIKNSEFWSSQILAKR